MASIPQISSIANLHGKTARAGGVAISGITVIKTITLKTITKR
jgi:hypothetical protein